MKTTAVVHDVTTPPSGTGIPDMTDAARLVYKSATRSLASHVHSKHRLEICHMDTGRQSYLIQGKRYTLAAGDVMIVLPGDSHSGDSGPEERGTISWCGFRIPEKGDSFLGLHGPMAKYLIRSLLDINTRHFAGSAELRLHLNAILATPAENRSDPAVQIHLLHHVLGLLLQTIDCAAHNQAGKPSGEWTARIIEHINSNIDSPLDLAGMAAFMKLSPSRFLNRFRTETGFSPRDYIRRRKIDIAKERLVNLPGKSITELAFDLGFESSQRFAVVFRQYAGLSPREYRIRNSSGHRKA